MGAVRALPPCRLHRADHRVRRTSGLLSTYHLELAWLGGETAVPDVLVEVDGDRIVTVTPGVAAPDGAVRLAGLTLPGLANAHSHAFHRALRGRTQAGVGSFWTWREQMYALADRLDPDSYHSLARAVYGEMAMAGITCVGEFHYLHHGARGHPYADPNAMGAALVAAADEAGVRITLLDTCYLHGGIHHDGTGIEPDPTQRRFSDGSAQAWTTRASAAADLVSPTARMGAAIHSVRAVDPDSIATVASWADERGAPLHAHVSEQPAENHQSVTAWALTPTELLDERGALSDRFTAVHATHLTDHDIRLLGLNRSTVCMCVTTERDLADGIGPAARLAEAGARLSLGSDSHAVIDLLEEARGVELDERLASNLRGTLGAPALLRAATDDGHRSIGWPDAGRIQDGALADLVTITLDSVRTAGTLPQHALEAVVFAATAADVRHVVSSGRVVVSDGVHRSVDVAAELGRCIRAVGEPT
ncbi:MAG: formimidoylglutamate deiminase [Ilumatobacteraceae bacterium]